MKINLLSIGDRESTEKRTRVVATAGALSRSDGNVSDVFEARGDYEKNKRYIERVIKMGHDSITDHDYLVFSLEDVSCFVEQKIIEERFSSFTIKSRREVNFSDAGYYIPEFRDKSGKILSNNQELQRKYIEHMNYLFESYGKLIDSGVKKEDARFVLPYSFHSNIIMGIDAHVLKNLIVRFTKGPESNISELKELGNKFYEIMEESIPYLKSVIDEAEIKSKDSLRELIDTKIDDKEYNIVDKVKLLSSTKNSDEVILITLLMNLYDYDYEKAKIIYDKHLKKDSNLQRELMLKIITDHNSKEFEQINFQFQIPISLAVLTHLTRHRTHHIMVPDLVPIKNLNNYITPNSLMKYIDMYDSIYKENNRMCEYFKEQGVREEDLIYFYLTGTKINIVTNIDGATLSHILKLRCCNKAQWEVRSIANEMKALVGDVAPLYSSVLGADCCVFGVCHEGKESCGKVKYLIKQN